MKRTARTAAAILLAVLGPIPLAGQCAGAPTLGPPATLVVGPGVATYDVEHADLDGDGDQDVVCLLSTQQLIVLRNAANVLVPELPLPVVPSTLMADMAVGDFNDDGLPDVAATGFLSMPAGPAVFHQPQTLIFINQTSGGGSAPAVAFAPPVVHPFGSLGCHGLAIRAADLNADGILDLAFVAWNSPEVWVMLGSGAFGIGDGTFAAPIPYSLGNTESVALAVGDFNQDGAPDIAVANAGWTPTPTVRVLAGILGPSGRPTGAFVMAGGAFMPGPSSVNDVEAADVNADGYLDLVVTSLSGVEVAHGVGGFGFSTTSYPTITPGLRITIGDFTLDGLTDLALTRDWGGAGIDNFSILVGQPNGGYTAYETFQVNPGYPRSIASADLDGDGRLEVVLGFGAGGTVDVLPSLCPQPATPLAVTVASPNGGEVVGPGSVTLSWTKSATVALVDLDVSRNGGVTWERIASNVAGTTYGWRVTPPGSSQALLRVRPSGISTVTDASDAPFTIVGAGAASSTVVGSGCAPAGPPPTLAISTPVLGGNTTVAISGAGGVHPAGVFLSPVPPSHPIVSPGCTVYLDLAALLLAVEPTTDAFGIWGTTVSLPMSNALIGLTLRAQAAIVLPAPPGYALTNAVQVEFGF